MAGLQKLNISSLQGAINLRSMTVGRLASTLKEERKEFFTSQECPCALCVCVCAWMGLGVCMCGGGGGVVGD